MNKIIKGTLLMTLMITALSSFAENVNDIKINSIKKKSFIEAKSWGLSNSEYSQYRQEMKNTPSGFWWKDIDPVQVLGMNAKLENEREKYAKKEVMLDHERASREIKFQRAYSKAFDELYPNAQLIKTRPTSSSLQLNAGDRFVLFTHVKNIEGAMIASRIIKKMNESRSVKFDIFFCGQATDLQIKKWAKANKVPIEVKNGNYVTLNHNKNRGNDMLKSILGYKEIHHPVLVRQRGDTSSLVKLFNL